MSMFRSFLPAVPLNRPMNSHPLPLICSPFSSLLLLSFVLGSAERFGRSISSWIRTRAKETLESGKREEKKAGTRESKRHGREGGEKERRGRETVGRCRRRMREERGKKKERLPRKRDREIKGLREPGLGGNRGRSSERKR